MTSKIKVDNIANQSDSNIVNKCGTTITLGASGDTINLASGASQSGFGRTGTVDWDTTPKTATFSAVSGNGYFCNTTAGVITVNLPAGSAGAIVSLADYAATWQTNNVTVAPNGTDKIGSLNENAVLNTEGQSVTFVFVDSTQGWINTMDSTSNVRGLPPFITATGGTITTVCTNFKVHTFTGPGTFTVTNAGSPTGSNTVDYLVTAGGGGGGGSHDNPDNRAGGAGGAGGFRESSGAASGCYTASPLGSGVSALPVSATSFPITVGAGGVGGVRCCATAAGNGSNSIFSTITSTGGGSGGTAIGGPISIPGCGGNGGSGGGGSGGGAGSNSLKGDGNTPPTSPAQGFDGGAGSNPAGGSAGGGGATAVGANADGPDGGAGGAGATSSINATPTARAGGGGGAGGSGGGKSGGSGGGGAGGSSNVAGTAATVNTGGGGGGAGFGPQGSSNSHGGAGGSGIVLIRYKFQ